MYEKVFKVANGETGERHAVEGKQELLSLGSYKEGWPWQGWCTEHWWFHCSAVVEGPNKTWEGESFTVDSKDIGEKETVKEKNAKGSALADKYFVLEHRELEVFLNQEDLEPWGQNAVYGANRKQSTDING